MVQLLVLIGSEQFSTEGVTYADQVVQGFVLWAGSGCDLTAAVNWSPETKLIQSCPSGSTYKLLRLRIKEK